MMVRGVSLLSVLALIVVGSLALFAWRSSGQQGPPVELHPTVTGSDVAATVNGQPVSALLVAIFEANGMEHGAALNTAIEQVLMEQGAQRLGLTATDEEAAEYVADWEEALGELSVDKRAEFEEALRSQGLPTSNLSQDARALEYGRVAKTIAKLQTFLLDRLAVANLNGAAPDDFSTPRDVDEVGARLDQERLAEARNMLAGTELSAELSRFVQQERANAVIVPVEQ